MKKLTQIFAVLIIITFVVTNISAQSEEKPVLVVSFQKVKLSDIQTVNKMINEKFAPILNALVDEKMIGSWGLFDHAWGDEWNVNIWYVAKNMEAFNTFWKEYVKRLYEKEPDAWVKLRDYIQEHKDNIYSIQNQYPIPPTE